ncbi:hypothetical protein E2C01_090540 [Portunus trituberculatus]|uniref:Uncharacterized protein n=1 Tax=Portunus trituberculatus TaxID=210409 RepID=A0A5B7JLM5_PORTR|nr:hypothetical protein [Portunus trituberculatus]
MTKYCIEINIITTTTTDDGGDGGRATEERQRHLALPYDVTPLAVKTSREAGTRSLPTHCSISADALSSEGECLAKHLPCLPACGRASPTRHAVVRSNVAAT